jgi:hypothetical protein
MLKAESAQSGWRYVTEIPREVEKNKITSP